MDCGEILHWRWSEKEGCFFQLCRCMHTQTITPLISAVCHDVHSLGPTYYLSIQRPWLCFSPLPSLSLPFFFFLPSLPPHSFDFYFLCCLLHFPLLFCSSPSCLPSSVSLPHLPFSPHLWPLSELSSSDRHQGQGNILRWRLAIALSDMTVLGSINF